ALDASARSGVQEVESPRAKPSPARSRILPVGIAAVGDDVPGLEIGNQRIEDLIDGGACGNVEENPPWPAGKCPASVQRAQRRSSRLAGAPGGAIGGLNRLPGFVPRAHAAPDFRRCDPSPRSPTP